jgi:hypothetical protein
MKNILDQLARNTGLLPEPLSAAILAGNTPPAEEIVMAVLIGCMDAYFVLDRDTSLNERCIARMALAVAFLAAMTVLGER